MGQLQVFINLHKINVNKMIKKFQQPIKKFFLHLKVLKFMNVNKDQKIIPENLIIVIIIKEEKKDISMQITMAEGDHSIIMELELSEIQIITKESVKMNYVVMEKTMISLALTKKVQVRTLISILFNK